MKPVMYESVWDAIADTPQEAASMKARSKLMMELSEIINTRKLRQKDAAELFGVTQPRISDLMRGKIHLFSLDMLMDMASTAGRRAFSANVMTQHFYWLFKRAGISGASSHTMRRSFITNLAAKGIGVRVLASLAGHRSIAVTQKYIDVNDDMKRNAVELV